VLGPPVGRLEVTVLIEGLADPTRFERATFAFGGQFHGFAAVFCDLFIFANRLLFP